MSKGRTKSISRLLWSGSMYVICTYDVDEKKCVKIMKILRRYMFHVQKSVFEGELTPAKFLAVKKELDKIIDCHDSILFYYSYENKKVKKEGLGKDIKDFNIII